MTTTPEPFPDEAEAKAMIQRLLLVPAEVWLRAGVSRDGVCDNLNWLAIELHEHNHIVREDGWWYCECGHQGDRIEAGDFQ